MLTQKSINDLAYKIVGCAIEVHKQVGPGLLESIYKFCLVEELKATGLNVQTELAVPIEYKGKTLPQELRLDILVNEIVIVEIKAVEQMIPLFQAQLLSYLELTK
jgi:GxxExxY protein